VAKAPVRLYFAVMAERFSLRPATPDDVNEIASIERAVHKAPWTPEHFRAEFEKPYSHVLLMTDDETDSRIAGYIVYWLLLDECQILDVVVDEKYRRLGFAKTMIRQAVGDALKAGAKKAVLDVRKSNLPAVELYQFCGFVITGVAKSFYSDGEDAYRMSLPLDDTPKTDF